MIPIKDKLPALEIISAKGFKTLTNLNFVDMNGHDFYIGYKDDDAIIVALITPKTFESNYMLSEGDITEMAMTARIKGIDKVYLYTNYGVELHHKRNVLKAVLVNKIIKIQA